MTAENPWVSQNKKQTKKKPTHTLLEMSMHYLGKDMRLFSTQHSLFLFSMDHVKKASGRPEFSTLTSRVTNYMDVMKMASLETKWGPTHVYIQAQPFLWELKLLPRKISAWWTWPQSTGISTLRNEDGLARWQDTGAKEAIHVCYVIMTEKDKTMISM